MKTLYLMVGCPGSGKSTYIINKIDKTKPTVAWISRDDIRRAVVLSHDGYFSSDNYFKYENTVFNVFENNINEAIVSKFFEEIYVDATHLNEKARNKVLDKLNLKNVNIVPIVFNLPLDICLKRNAGRTGTACVPESALKRMWYSQTNPKEDTKYSYYDIIEVNE